MNGFNCYPFILFIHAMRVFGKSEARTCSASPFCKGGQGGFPSSTSRGVLESSREIGGDFMKVMMPRRASFEDYSDEKKTIERWKKAIEAFLDEELVERLSKLPLCELQEELKRRPFEKYGGHQ